MTRNGTTHVKLKVVVVGDAAVGKTSLALRFTENKFGDSYVLTVGGKFFLNVKLLYFYFSIRKCIHFSFRLI